MTKTLPLTTVAGLVWNDAHCECSMTCVGNWEADGEPCDSCLVATYEEKVDELGDEFIESVMAKGLLNPINLNAEGTRVMDGHHRLSLAILLMLDEVPVVFGEYTEDLDDEPTSYC